jgi:hypothetical protein
MTRLAERLGYLWQRYVAWHDPRPFKREPRACLARSRQTSLLVNGDESCTRT